MEVGDRFRFFDSVDWTVAGGDVGDNDCFFKPATVERVYHDAEGRELVDIRFDHRRRLSTGHFTDIVKEI